MGYPASNELFSKSQMDSLIATISGEEAPEATYPAYNELPSKEQGDALIEAVDDFITGLPTQGIAVADAAGTNPTAAEFKALLDSLRNAGVIAKNSSSI